jgi:hypothetical protein
MLIVGIYFGKLSLLAYPNYYDGWNKALQPFLSAVFFAPLTKLYYFKPINADMSAKQVRSNSVFDFYY